jgi:hypothetical protein
MQNQLVPQFYGATEMRVEITKLPAARGKMRHWMRCFEMVFPAAL